MSLNREPPIEFNISAQHARLKRSPPGPHLTSSQGADCTQISDLNVPDRGPACFGVQEPPPEDDLIVSPQRKTVDPISSYASTKRKYDDSEHHDTRRGESDDFVMAKRNVLAKISDGTTNT